MTVEILLYIVGVLLVPALGLSIQSFVVHRDLARKVDKLVHMHEHPENTGFGTVGLRGVVEDNTRALKALTHYIQWLETKNGLGPPPPL
jgi:hypothetical protein